MSKNLVIFGAGPMAVEYSKILSTLGINFEVVGRSQKSAQAFKSATGKDVAAFSLEEWFKLDKKTDYAIVAVSEENLDTVATSLIDKKIKNVLIEKPGGATVKDVRTLAAKSKNSETNIYIGYNRRFYESVQHAKKIISEDGGVDSFFFEFTEWGHVVKEKVCPQIVKDEWLLHNSTHVMDLAFYLGGYPSEIFALKSGSLDWHKRASKYSGTGKTSNGALFSYIANWAAPGRWGVEILTRKHRLIFRPLEALQVQKIGSVAIESVSLNNELDTKYKPGLYKQVVAFLEGNSPDLLTIEDQVKNLEWYEKIENGNVS